MKALYRRVDGVDHINANSFKALSAAEEAH